MPVPTHQCNSQSCPTCHPPSAWSVHLLVAEYSQGRMEVSQVRGHLGSLRAERRDLHTAILALERVIHEHQRALQDACDALRAAEARANEAREAAAREAGDFFDRIGAV